MEENGYITVHDVLHADLEDMLDEVFEKEIAQVLVKVWNDKDREHRQYMTVKVKSNKQPKRQLHGIRFKVNEVTYFSEKVTYITMDYYVDHWNAKYNNGHNLFEIKYV